MTHAFKTDFIIDVCELYLKADKKSQNEMLKQFAAKPLGYAVGSLEYHNLIKLCEAYLDRNLRRGERNKIAFMCEGKRHRTTKSYRAAKLNQRKHDKALRRAVGRSEAVNGALCTAPVRQEYDNNVVVIRKGKRGKGSIAGKWRTHGVYDGKTGELKQS